MCSIYQQNMVINVRITRDISYIKNFLNIKKKQTNVWTKKWHTIFSNLESLQEITIIFTKKVGKNYPLGLFVLMYNFIKMLFWTSWFELVYFDLCLFIMIIFILVNMFKTFFNFKQWFFCHIFIYLNIIIKRIISDK
jgi:Na+/H+-dicarboxylate symporter